MKITNEFPASFAADSPGMKDRVMAVSPGTKTETHNHHDRECWSIAQGKGVLSSGDAQVAVRPGEHVEFAPFDVHTVENWGAVDLCFTAHWIADWDSVRETSGHSLLRAGPLMIETAFPTPNGPLHLGHLSGAYLLSDILRRCCELAGTVVFSYCGTFGHTNHIEKTAAARGMTNAELIARSERIIREDLTLFQASYDDFLPHVPASPAFEVSTARFINVLRASPLLMELEVQHPYSAATGEFVAESYVAGQCPHCGGGTIGMECENCGLYQDECHLVAPFHSLTKEKLVHRPVKRLYLRLDRSTLRKLMVRMYGERTAASRICHDRLKEYLERKTLNDVPVSSLREHGVPVYGDQVLSIVMERALRSYHGLAQFPQAARHVFFCGFDNLCGSGVLLPYVLSALGIPDAQLPVASVNRFCLLENRKFSTGANHAIWAGEFLHRRPSDLVRLYLASTARRPRAISTSTTSSTAPPASWMR